MAQRDEAAESEHPRGLQVGVRWAALILGVVLVAVAFLAAGRVADTREGLVFEVITLLGGLLGGSLFLYGLAARTRRPRPAATPMVNTSAPVPPLARTANDLVAGGGGLVVAAVLVIGTGVSAGPQWALLGLVVLLPMVAGCSYLVIRFLRAPERDWRIDLTRLTGRQSRR
jgi:peptidoglycan/LPS O-acetylase OafA/YrhL